MKLGFAIPHKITIRASANMGFIVKVGCGEFTAPDEINLLADLEQYLKDPEKWEKEYNELPGAAWSGRGGDVIERTDPEPPHPFSQRQQQTNQDNPFS